MFRLCSNKFIGRGAPKSGTATHILHLKQLKNPVDFMRYVKGVVFPGKAFMIDKYLGQQTTDNGQRTTEQIEVQRRSRPSGRTKSKDGKKGDVSSSELRVTSKTSTLRTPNSILRTKFWWLWYPYRWWVALCQWQTGAGDF